MTLSRDVRTAIFALREREVSIREIAKSLGISRSSVRKVLRSGSKEVPPLDRPEKAEPYRDEILALYARCEGNFARVHEELVAQGAELSYPALTAFCRRQGIGVKTPNPVGEYTFEPGEEVQHDTSPHHAIIAAKRVSIQTAGAVLGYSRMVFHQCYPRFRRFECKLFLDAAAKYFDGVSGRCVIDNTHVVVLHATGARMVPAPEMEAFARRYGFVFFAHEKGDSNRSALVENSFRHFENNFLAGRTFESWNHLQQEVVTWCDRKNNTFRRHLKASARELFAAEHAALTRLPLHCPEPYLLDQRIVDVRGFVSLDANRYSVPVDWIGRRVEVRETASSVVITLDRHTPVEHVRLLGQTRQTVILPDHRGQRRSRRVAGPADELAQLGKIAPEAVPYAEALLAAKPQQPTIAIRHLLRMVREYPREPLVRALRRAQRYGLFDLARLERLVLRTLATDFFLLDDLLANDPENET